MLAYHGSEEIKAKYVARFAVHRDADQVIQGIGFNNDRGCFVGCTLDAYEHARFPIELGWPEWLARLADTIFEGVPKAEAPQFGTDLIEAVKVGSDLEKVRVPFLLTIQYRNLERLKGNNEPYAEQCKTAVQGVVDWLVAGAKEGESAASVRSAAESAESSAAESVRSAARSAESVRSAAWSVWSAAESVRSAARSAESSAAESSVAESSAWSVRSAAWSVRSVRSADSSESQTQREDLLRIIRSL